MPRDETRFTHARNGFLNRMEPNARRNRPPQRPAHIRPFQGRTGTVLLSLAIGLMALAACFRLPFEFHRLLWDTGPLGAIDLKVCHEAAAAWFQGEPVYQTQDSAVNPPASYLILWPFLGWSSFATARWLWAGISVASLICLMGLLIRASRTETVWGKTFWALFPLSMYATTVAVGNGQTSLPVLPALLGSLFLLEGDGPARRKALVAPVLFLFALSKPTLATPFLWIILFRRDRWRASVSILAGYLLLTFAAAQFQDDGAARVLDDWSQRGVEGAAWGAVRGGYLNVHTWLGRLGLERWNLPASLLLLAALGLWVHRHRREDIWLLMGVSAVGARIWAYHRCYDDALLLIPMMTLCRMVQADGPKNGRHATARLLLAMAWLSSLLPARVRLEAFPLNLLFYLPQWVVWGSVLFFLLAVAETNRTAPVARVAGGEETPDA